MMCNMETDNSNKDMEREIIAQVARLGLNTEYLINNFLKYLLFIYKISFLRLVPCN